MTAHGSSLYTSMSMNTIHYYAKHSGNVVGYNNKITLHRAQHLNQSPRPTQPLILCGSGNEYRANGGDALCLRTESKYGSFHLGIHVWVTDKTV